MHHFRYVVAKILRRAFAPITPTPAPLLSPGQIVRTRAMARSPIEGFRMKSSLVSVADCGECFQDGFTVHERVLVVEDDPSVREVTALGLERAGFRVDAEEDGAGAMDRVRANPTRFDAVVLDLMLPSLDGFEVCREIRRLSRVPIVMVTAKTDLIDVVAGLEAGADDYVRKPFDVPELVARLRAMLRRSKEAPHGGALFIGDLEIDTRSVSVRKGHREIPLTAMEFRLLVELAQRPGWVFSREVLLERVWDKDYLGDSRLVDMAIKRLREKLEDDPRRPQLIKTVRGMGYRLESE
jgi:two-component system response regulator MtrA